MANEHINKADPSQASLISQIVSRANRDVADRFGFTRENAARHPSFCTPEWIEEDFKRGVIYFIFRLADVPAGCVAFETPEKGTAYLNRLSVLPEYRHRGIGEKLVDRHLAHAAANNIHTVSIGIIAGHTRLKNWYTGLGFQEVNTVTFDHLPFDVCYMKYAVNDRMGK